MDDLMNTGDLMTYFKASDKTIYRYLNAGLIPGAFKMLGVWYIHREVFLEGLKVKATNRQKGDSVKSRHF